jgi:hypothetical protein
MIEFLFILKNITDSFHIGKNEWYSVIIKYYVIYYTHIKLEVILLHNFYSKILYNVLLFT